MALQSGDRRHRVHWQSPRAVGAARGSAGWRASPPRHPNPPWRRPPSSARSGPSTRPRRWCATPAIDVVHICTPNHLHLPLAEAALAAGKHVICEKPLALDAAGAQRLVDAGSRLGPPRGGALRLPVLPDGARGARACRQRQDRRPAPSARHLSAGLAPAPRRRQLARGRAARRRLARLCRHRLALVRPGRVRLRPSHRPPVRADAHRGARAIERAGSSGVRVRRRRRARRARSRPKTLLSSSSRRTAGPSAPWS